MKVKNVDTPTNVEVTFELSKDEMDFLTKEVDVFKYFTTDDQVIIELFTTAGVEKLLAILKDFIKALNKGNEN